jgi:hypothetical protein
MPRSDKLEARSASTPIWAFISKCHAASCRYVHDAESLLPGGRGAPTQIDEVTLPRVRWAKDPVGLNRRSDGGGLWVLNR